MNDWILSGLIILSIFTSIRGFAAVDKISCESIKGSKRITLEVQQGKNTTAINEPADRLQARDGHKLGAFYYPGDDSLGLIIDDATNTTYQVSKLAPQLLTFLTLRDGTEIKCHSASYMPDLKSQDCHNKSLAPGEKCTTLDLDT